MSTREILWTLCCGRGANPANQPGIAIGDPADRDGISSVRRWGAQLLGKTFDIHGGGKDLIFPHHENEIAQSEAAFAEPFVRYWLHNGFVNINNEKMSKSLGNFFTIRDILQQVNPEALRLFVLSKHYRSPVDFSDESIGEAERGLERLYSTIATVRERVVLLAGAPTPDRQLETQDAELFARLTGFEAAFQEAMDNDFNTALAIGHLFELQRALRRLLDRFGQKRLKGAAAVLAHRAGQVLQQCGQVLGLLVQDPRAFLDQQRLLKLPSTGMTVREVEQCIALRHEARLAKNYAESDRIRDDLARRGIIFEDGPEGTSWRVGASQDGATED